MMVMEVVCDVLVQAFLCGFFVVSGVVFLSDIHGFNVPSPSISPA